MRDKSNTMRTVGTQGNVAREEHDYYATEPYAIELLLEEETFDDNIWECASGEGHISKVLEGNGYTVFN